MPSAIVLARKDLKEVAAGFTLVETLIYVAVIILVVVSFISFIISISNSRNKAYVVSETQANARTAMDVIGRIIRDSNGVNVSSSTFDTDPGVLSLSMSSSTLNPTVISLSSDDGILQVTEGYGSPVFVTTDEVKITNLVFTNSTPGKNRKNISVDLTVEYDNLSGSVYFDYDESWHSTFRRRK